MVTMRAGGYYIRRDGETVGPASVSGLDEYPWEVGREFYTNEGRFWYGADAPDQSEDLVREVVEAKARGPAVSESQLRKRTPVYSGVMMYFPDALQAIARVSFKGNEKHNPGQPLHWSREKSSDHMDCVARHILTPDEIDPECGETHLANAAWRILAQLQLQQEKLKGQK